MSTSAMAVSMEPSGQRARRRPSSAFSEATPGVESVGQGAELLSAAASTMLSAAEQLF